MESIKDLLNDPKLVILDVETTGLDGQAECCQIGIISPRGEVLLDTLVKPVGGIPASATAIHGITDDMSQDSPTILELEPELKRLLGPATVAVYNADFDRRLLRQSFEAHGTEKQWLNDCKFVDVMVPYAEFWGEWNDHFQSYRWQSLVSACRQQGITIENAHSAVGDCRATLALLKEMYEKITS